MNKKSEKKIPRLYRLWPDQIEWIGKQAKKERIKDVQFVRNLIQKEMDKKSDS